MCGIFGIIFSSHRKDLGRILLDAGRRLTYRGYDSVGIAVFRPGSIELRKDVGEIEEVNRRYRFEEMEGYKGIAQLRWATFGRPIQKNAQPHYDCSGDLVGAHNGNIINTKELIAVFKSRGHRFLGENDGEVCVHAVEEAYRETGDLGSGLRKADTVLKGDYAFVITEKDSQTMHCVKKYSSLYLGVGDGFICCSSDLPSIIPLTKKIVSIYDGEYVEFGWDRYQIHKLDTGGEVSRDPYLSTLDVEQAQKGEFPHFMLKEIHEQPDKVSALARYLTESGSVDELAGELEASRKIYLIGSGSSYNACVIGAAYLNRIAGAEAMPMIAGAAAEYLPLDDVSGRAFVLVSQSGETKDVINVLNVLEKNKARQVFGVVNVIGSSLQLRVKKHLPLLSNIEISVPATKTFLNQVVCFLYLALKLAELKGRPDPGLAADCGKLPGLIKETIRTAWEPCRRLAPALADKEYLYYLGYGISFGAALEAALKMKEITYIPCEGMYSSEFKHGPLAIIKPGDWVLFLSTVEDAHMTLSHINEVSCRSGRICTIAPPDPSLVLNSDEFIPLPSPNRFLAPVLEVVVAQLISYAVSQVKGINPDQPRNISKTLTVD